MARRQIAARHHVRRSLPNGVKRRVTHKIRHRLGTPVGMLSMRDIPTEYRLMVDRFREYTALEAAQ
jgi:hypothetical protein